jgi:hypothetical protein
MNLTRRVKATFAIGAVVLAILFALNATFPEWFGGRWW